MSFDCRDSAAGALHGAEAAAPAGCRHRQADAEGHPG